MSEGPYVGRKDEPLFIGWDKAPAIDRRFLLGAIPLSLAGVGAAAFGVAGALDDPGAGEWASGKIETVAGALIAAPYPMIRVADAAAPFGVRTWLVVAQGKCTSALKLSAAPRLVTARGVKIARGDRRMLEVPLLLNEWLEPAPDLAIDEAAIAPAPVSLGRARLAGAIMDTKCFFGVMRPGRGRAHKACASLCIRGGIPPSFWARRADGRESVLLMTDEKGGPLGEAILPLVADPVEAEGEIMRVGDLLQFRADAGAYRRASSG